MSEKLHFLLHPADVRDIPVPGFPTHDALVAWGRSQPYDEIVEATIQILREDDPPQQYAAMALLRAMGIPVQGDGYGDAFRWVLSVPGRARLVVDPAVKDQDPWADEGPAPVDTTELNGLKATLATAVTRLEEMERVILTLHYYEALDFDQIAEVLGTTQDEIRRRHRAALEHVRATLAGPTWDIFERIATTTPEQSETVGMLAFVRGLAAA